MPCRGPDPAEYLQVEREQNKNRLGNYWTNEEAAVNVACAYAAHVRHGKKLPRWAERWAIDHEEQDLMRQEADKAARDQELRKKEALYEQLKKELGK